MGLRYKKRTNEEFGLIEFDAKRKYNQIVKNIYSSLEEKREAKVSQKNSNFKNEWILISSQIDEEDMPAAYVSNMISWIDVADENVELMPDEEEELVKSQDKANQKITSYLEAIGLEVIEDEEFNFEGFMIDLLGAKISSNLRWKMGKNPETGKWDVLHVDDKGRNTIENSWGYASEPQEKAPEEILASDEQKAEAASSKTEDDWMLDTLI